MPHILVTGIVAIRNGEPYLVVDVDGHSVQMSMADARNVARDIEVMCARTEADAMIHRFFAKQGFPEQAGAALMLEFRDFRAKLDEEVVEKTREDPDQ
jgi:hypothetical protein